MGAIKDIFGKDPEKVKINDVRKLIKEKREESHTLEYKSPKILNKPVDLSKWVSAFLNSDGGLIIIGVTEDNPSKKDRIEAKIYPEKIEFVNTEFNKERVDQIISSNIYSAVKPDIPIYPLRGSRGVSETIYLIEIPQGNNPPYQAADERYYRRLNSTKYPVKHYEIADFFGKRRKPNLELIFKLIKASGGIKNTFDLQVFVTNTGNAIAKNARIIVSFENLNILKIKRGSRIRIDELRGNIATLQWDNTSGVIFPNTKKGSLDLIWDLQVQPTSKFSLNNSMKIGNILWEAMAEDMDLIEGKNELIPIAFKMEEGRDYYLPRYEDIWGKNGDEKLKEDAKKEIKGRKSPLLYPSPIPADKDQNTESET